MTAESEDSLADLAGLRGSVYGLLGSLFLYPARDDLADVVAEASAFPGHLARDFPFFPSLRVLLDVLSAAVGGEPERLEREYVGLFVVGASQPPCPPYASAYLEQRGRKRGLVSVEVERAYAASGVTLAAGGELPDHVALELAFLSVLCAEEERAWREAETDEAVDWLRRQEEFHEAHLQTWFPLFARRLVRVPTPGSLYRALSNAACAFLVHDRDLVRVLVGARSAGGLPRLLS